MENIKIRSNFDGLMLGALYIAPKNPKGIIQIVHGMAEHKERYIPFMKFLADNGFVVIINDHRGHGESVKESKDLGYFYTDDIKAIVGDMYQVTNYIKDKFSDLPFYIFSHSMGTLVTRVYLQKYDNVVDKVVLCGPPTKNSLVSFGLLLAKHRANKSSGPDEYINKMTFSSFNEGYMIPNEWICRNKDTVKSYNEDPLCGFTFTSNGFVNLFKLQKSAFRSTNYLATNLRLPILFMAGSDDPVIISEKKFNKLVKFFNNLGYKNTQSKLYKGLRHELLNEKGNEKIFSDILTFFNE